MKACAAAWYELNINSADDYVSTCCYYSGEVDKWQDEAVPIEDYWNGQPMRVVRQLRSTPEIHAKNGCENYAFFSKGPRLANDSVYYDFFNKPAGLSSRQSDN